jgi:predicted RNase H-like HicB family nuclease
MTRKQIKEQAARYAKFVERSDEDQCFIGSCPKIMLSAVHGNDKKRVYAELCGVVEDWIELLYKDGAPLPDPSTAKSSSDKFVPRMGPPIHRRLNVKAIKRRESLVRQGYSKDDANLLAQMASADIAKNDRVFLNPITMEFNLESGIVSYERFDKARRIITERLNQLRQIWAPTPAESELEQLAKVKYDKEEFAAELLKRPTPKLPRETPKLTQPN